jgi:plasmid stabilization system protein ParE
MEERIPRKTIDVSDKFKKSRTQIYDYTHYTFGYFQAERYLLQIERYLSSLSEYFTVYPECRHLATQSRMYRNIILDAHLIIYRITDKRIEVLDIIHSASSVRKIRGVRSIHL